MVFTQTDMPSFLDDRHLRLLLFGGKGGVGKTTCALATALHFARSSPGGSFLLVSTDPAHSLVHSMADFTAPPNLKIVELNAGESLARFKESHNRQLQEIACRGTFMDEEDVSRFLDLSLPGLDELMAFLEISKWAAGGNHDCVVVDTAPTGHTLGLLKMPELIGKWIEALDTLVAKHRYMKRLFSGCYHRDDLDEFLLELSGSVKHMVSLLRDPVRCCFVVVMLAEELCMQETVRLLEELEHLQIGVTDLIVNKLYPENTCPVCREARTRQLQALWEGVSRLQLNNPQSLPCKPPSLLHWSEIQNVEILNPRPVNREASFTGVQSAIQNQKSYWSVPLYPQEIRSLNALEAFWANVSPIDISLSPFRIRHSHAVSLVESPGNLPPPEIEFLLFAGKGGVGKTTLACATAIRLARDFPGKQVFLFSTDPANSLSACMDLQIGPEPTKLASGITAMEIDAEAEFETLKSQYAEEVQRFLRGISSGVDLTFDREVMERITDLSPPGLDEVMALTLAMRFLAQGRFDVFILDSAPSGHLIRLLELPELVDQWVKAFFELFLKYRRVFRLPRISRRLVQMSKDLKSLRGLLHDPHRSALYAVANLTEMAFLESKDLVAACEKMGVNVEVLFLNLATPLSECPLCSALYERESQVKKKFQKTFSRCCQTVVYRQGEPRGLQQLGDLGESLYKPVTKGNDFRMQVSE